MKRAATVLFLLLSAALAPQATAQSVFLDPNNPLANFVKDGNQGYVPGAVMVLGDTSGSDHVAFWGAFPAAAPGQAVDVTASLRIQSNDQPSGIDTGMRLVITDAAVTSLIVGFVTLGGIPGVAISLGGSAFSSPENYAGFVAADWLNRVTLTIRRYANYGGHPYGGGEIISVNGVMTPPGSTFVPAPSLPGPTREIPSVGFGLFSDVAFTTVEITEFSAVAVIPEPSTYALLLAGLGLLGFAARRRKQKELAAA